MDNQSITELIKQMGAILVALIGASGAIIATIVQVRGTKQIQELKDEDKRKGKKIYFGNR